MKFNNRSVGKDEIVIACLWGVVVVSFYWLFRSKKSDEDSTNENSTQEDLFVFKSGAKLVVVLAQLGPNRDRGMSSSVEGFCGQSRSDANDRITSLHLVSAPCARQGLFLAIRP